MKSLYSTKSTVTGGRMGTATLSDSDLEINMVPPGGNEKGNNPEQLLAMGYGACFDGSTVETSVDLLQGDNHEYKLAVKIHVIADNTDLSADEIQRLVEKAHEVCPYSKATSGNIDVEVSSEVK